MSAGLTIGVAIPAHNRIDHTLRCLEAVHQSSTVLDPIVVVDDGSTDGTTCQIRDRFPQVRVLAGDGSLWWTGATNLAVNCCLEANCDFVLLLNQDCLVEPDTVGILLEAAMTGPRGIYSAVNVYRDNSKQLHWLGTMWEPVVALPIVYQARAVRVPRMHVDNLPSELVACDMIGGRGVLIPAAVFQKTGLFDSKCLPQYGADNDFALRARRFGFRTFVVPKARVKVGREESVVFSGRGNQSFFRRAWSLLWERRNGEAAKVWWILAWRHTPSLASLPTYLRMIILTLWRAWLESNRRII